MLTIDYVLYRKHIEHLFKVSQYHQMFEKVLVESLHEKVQFSRLSVKPEWMGNGLAKRLIY